MISSRVLLISAIFIDSSAGILPENNAISVDNQVLSSKQKMA
jgi:hypothetical protein